MNDLTIINRFNDVIEHPGNYEIEFVTTAYDTIKVLKSQLYDAEKKLKNHIENSMIADRATKVMFKDYESNDMELTLGAGSMAIDRSLLNAFVAEYSEAGFDLDEVGSLKFSPVWSKAKKIMRLGNPRAAIIEKYFKEGSKKISVKGVVK